jgi:hypothetical protein
MLLIYRLIRSQNFEGKQFEVKTEVFISVGFLLETVPLNKIEVFKFLGSHNFLGSE